MREPRSAAGTAALYALFAAAASGTNLLVQWLAKRLYRGPGATYAALAAGTAAGLLLKYALDALFIFGVRISATSGELARLLRYGLTGIATTALFWAVELSFARLAPFEGSLYVGGAIGLTAGYAAKYLLDARLVFRRKGTS